MMTSSFLGISMGNVQFLKLILFLFKNSVMLNDILTKILICNILHNYQFYNYISNNVISTRRVITVQLLFIPSNIYLSRFECKIMN